DSRLVLLFVARLWAPIWVASSSSSPCLLPNTPGWAAPGIRHDWRERWRLSNEWTTPCRPASLLQVTVRKGARAAQQPTRREEANMNERTVTQASATKRVLIIDDEPTVLTVLRDFFASFRTGTRSRSPRQNPLPEL